MTQNIMSLMVRLGTNWSICNCLVQFKYLIPNWNRPPRDFCMEKPRLLDQVRKATRLKHYSIGPEQAYINGIKKYIFFTKNAIRTVSGNSMK